MNTVTKPRGQFVVSLTPNIERILKPLIEHKRLSYEKLKNLSELHGGTWSSTFADCKILGLIKSNGSIIPTTDGEHFYSIDQPSLRREFFLRVDYFREMNEQGIATITKAKAFLKDKFRDHYKGTTREHMAKLAARRYIEYIYGGRPAKQRKKHRSRKETQHTLTTQSMLLSVLEETLTRKEQEVVIDFLVMNEQSPLTQEKKITIFQKLRQKLT